MVRTLESFVGPDFVRDVDAYASATELQFDHQLTSFGSVNVHVSPESVTAATIEQESVADCW